MQEDLEHDIIIESAPSPSLLNINEYEELAPETSIKEILIAMQLKLNEFSTLQSEVQELKTECNYLRGRCNKLEEALKFAFEHLDEKIKSTSKDCKSRHEITRGEFWHHRGLIKNSSWKYSAPEIPSTHWESRGFDQARAMGAGFLVECFKDMSVEMRQGTDRDGVIYLEFCAGDFEQNPPFPHDVLLLPHWREFANALKEYRMPPDWHGIHGDNRDTCFRIMNTEMPGEVVELIQNATRYRRFGFKKLHFENNSFGRCGLEFIAHFIKINDPKLQELTLINNDITSVDMDLVEELCDAIQEHPSLKSLTISNCFRGELGGSEFGMDAMKTILRRCTKLTELDLSNNNIATNGDNFLANYVSGNSALESLCLHHNDFHDGDAIIIAYSLRRNRKLESLSLSHNHITSRGVNAFKNAIFDQSSLNAAAGSNHTCHVNLGLDYNIEGNFCGEAKANRGAKIYTILSRRHREGTNVNYLEEAELQLELMPNVFDLIGNSNIYSDDDQWPLSLVYEILRGWKMPVLFQQSRWRKPRRI